MIEELDVPAGKGSMIDLLVTAHRSGNAGAGTPEYEKLCMDLKPSKVARWVPTEDDETMELEQAVKFRHLVTVAVYGDPEHCPGLTTPAVKAIEDLLRPDDDDIQEGVVRKPFPRRARATANTILDIEDRSEPKQYERLALVLERLASILHHLPNGDHDRGWFIARPMAEILRTAPTQALAGPLQPLVQAFGQRIQDGKLASRERDILERIVADHAFSGQPVDAFRPVADVL